MYTLLLPAHCGYAPFNAKRALKHHLKGLGPAFQNHPLPSGQATNSAGRHGGPMSLNSRGGGPYDGPWRPSFGKVATPGASQCLYWGELCPISHWVRPQKQPFGGKAVATG